MKKSLSVISRVGLVAVTVGGICCVGSTYAIDENSAAARLAAKSSPSPTPGGTGTTGAGAQATKANSATAGSSSQGGVGQLSDMDRKFIMQAAKDGMHEVHMGQMAVQQGQSDTVKKLGQTIMSDHSRANQELMKVATKNRLAPDTRHKMAKMSKKDMENFDQAWLAMMVKDHQKDIALYQQQVQQGSDPEVKKFAQKTLPVLQKHLKLVQAAQQKMGSGAAGGAGGTSGGQGGASGAQSGAGATKGGR
jgi:putative membrane protein